MSSSIRKQLEAAAKKAIPTGPNPRVLGMRRKAWMENEYQRITTGTPDKV